ncbi:MAG: 50S ribosomal protein L10 [Ferruginibacter sp.]|nr:50S ribosomal protein L10 [Ferruginibacter sp.]
MTKQEKNDVIEVLKGKFSQYSNFYITDTESLSVAQITKLRSHCFDKQVEMKVAKNTLIKKALESIDAEKYAGVFDSLHRVTALMFSENPKDPAVILAGFRKANNNEKPELKAAFINGDIFTGDNQLKALTMIKTKNELVGEVIGLLLAPIQRVLGALQNKDAAKEVVTEEAAPVVAETTAAEPVSEAAAVEPVVEESPAVEVTPATEVPAEEKPATPKA